jgi:ABC-type sugar transport system ATPase subunit
MNTSQAGPIPVLEMRGIGKSFPGVRALYKVDFILNRGEVLALVGENGAGKSTLMNILAGVLQADQGEILIDGKPVAISGPRAASALGIGMIHQELQLVPEFGAAANIFLGQEMLNGFLVDDKQAREKAAVLLQSLGLSIDGEQPTCTMSVAQRQVIEIAKALSHNARIMVMDEPTAALSDHEVDRLFALIGKLKAQGVAIIYISHRLEELARIADRITVLRDGSVIDSRPFKDMPTNEMIRLMVGREVTQQYPELPPVKDNAQPVLVVSNLTAVPKVSDVSFAVRSGEIVALAGLVGAGRTEIVRAIAGADAHQGQILVDGKPVNIDSPAAGIKAGIALITEDRRGQGLVVGMSIRENISMAHLAKFSRRGGLIDSKQERQVAQRYIAELKIKTPSADQIVGNLSGGNQQKVVLAKWLVGSSRLFIFDEPTRGIDVGARAEIYQLMIDLASKGAAIIVVSSDLPEVLGLAHRVLVVRDGRIAGTLTREQATQDRIMSIATGADVI